MGCGASKSSQVVDTRITIKDGPSIHSDGTPSIDDSTQLSSTLHTSEIHNDPSGQSIIEREVQASLHRSSRGTHTQPVDSTVQDREHGQAVASSTSTDAYPKPVVFEVCMSSDGITSPKQPPPRRLAKMESAPKLTPEILAEKQRQVEERKKKELDKRAHTRVSKRDRLRKEIVEAREMELSQQQYTQLEKKRSANSINRSKAQSDIIEKQKKRERHAKKVREKSQHLLTGGDDESGTCSYDASVEMDVDSTYNTDQQVGLWESQSSQNSSNNGKQVTSKKNDSDNDFFDTNESNKLEEYM